MAGHRQGCGILRGNFSFAFWFLIIVMVVLPSCGSQTINFPAPFIKSICVQTGTTCSGTTVVQNSPQVIVQVNGNNFVQGTTVGVTNTPGGAPIGLVTLFDTGNLLTGTLPASLLTSAGTLYFSVTTPQPGGGVFPPANQTKISFPLVVTPASSPIPHITSISPSSALAATSATVTVFVIGTNFVPQSVATLNGKNLPTIFESTTSVEASVDGNDLTAPGTEQIAILNPAPGGGVSNQLPLSILNPVPSLTSVTPTSVQAGAAATTLAVAGTGFVSQFTSITLNGAPLPTTVTSTTAASISLTIGDLAFGGVNQIAVVNPGPGGGTSVTKTFAVNPTHLLGLPILVDVAADGSQASTGICGGVSNCQNGTLGLTTSTVGPSTSNTGQFVAFASASHNLVLGNTNPSTDVYLQNTCLGVAACVPITSVISLGPAGIPANGSSSEPTINVAGTTAAFTSLATNLVNTVPVPGGMTQVYWRPICIASGATDCTENSPTSPVPQLISIAADGQSAGNGPSYSPVISPDGQYVAFVSLATNLVSDITPSGTIPQIYVRNTCNISTATTVSTCIPTTFLVSAAPDGVTQANGATSNPSIADSGLFVSFTSVATNLGSTAPNPLGASEIFERSTCVTSIGTTGNTCVPVTTLISTPDGTTPADGASDESSISTCASTTVTCSSLTLGASGRFVAFASTATNLVVGTGTPQQIYVRDTCNGVVTVTTTCTPSTTLVSTANGTTPGNGLSERPSISATGQFIAFSSLASNLTHTTNGIENIFVRNTCLGTSVTCTTGLALSSVSGGTNAAPSNGQNLVPSISADGHTVSFLSFSNNLVPRDNNGVEDIFLGSTTF